MDKLSKEDKELIESFCQKLPILYILDDDGNLRTSNVKTSLLGSQLLEKGYKEVEGKKIKPRKRYLLTEYLIENPVDFLTKAFLIGGKDAMVAACEEYMLRHEENCKIIGNKKLKQNAKKVDLANKVEPSENTGEVL